MNQTLEKIMTFINENTNILIGICLFLIFVLIGYLIDNSIKSRKAKKEFKKLQNQSQEKEKNTIKVESENNDIENNKNLFESAVSTPENSINLNDNITNDIDISNDIKLENDTTYDKPLTNNNINFENEIDGLNDIVGAIDTINTETQNLDLSDNESTIKTDVSYKNDKKLSEILFSDVNKEEQNEVADFNEISKNTIDDNIFSDEKVVSSDINQNDVDSKVEIELGENELDNIMKKLKNLSSIDEDDNYTNIF